MVISNSEPKSQYNKKPSNHHRTAPGLNFILMAHLAINVHDTLRYSKQNAKSRFEDYTKSHLSSAIGVRWCFVRYRSATLCTPISNDLLGGTRLQTVIVCICPSQCLLGNKLWWTSIHWFQQSLSNLKPNFID